MEFCSAPFDGGGGGSFNVSSAPSRPPRSDEGSSASSSIAKMTNATRYIAEDVDFFISIFILSNYSIKIQMSSNYTIASASYKDSNANFLNRIRDASDVTTMIRQQGLRRSYRVLHDKGLSPQGGIPQSHLVDMAHTVGSFAPMNSLMNLSFSECATCAGIPYSQMKVSLSFVRY